MNELFVPYNESLHLKELGFDEPCFGKYLSSLQSDWKDFELTLEMGVNEEFENNRNIYLIEGACSAPTFSQAFKFFREKYKLHGTININLSISMSELRDFEDHECALAYYPEIKTITNSGIDCDIICSYIDDNSPKCDSHEEAEIACLRKLIQIVKNEQTN